MKSIKVRSSSSEINAPQQSTQTRRQTKLEPRKDDGHLHGHDANYDGHRNLDVPEPTVHLLKKVLPKHPQRLLKPHLHNRILPVAVPKLCLACLPLKKLKRRQQKKTH